MKRKRKSPTAKKSSGLMEGLVSCPECGYVQADMGKNVRCEGESPDGVPCNFGPMPTKGR